MQCVMNLSTPEEEFMDIQMLVLNIVVLNMSAIVQ